MKPLILGRCPLYEFLVRKEPEIALTVVCKSSLVPVLFNAPSGSFNLRLRLFGPANQADIVSVVFRREFLGDGSFTALMVKRTWRHIGTEAFCLVVFPQLVFGVFDYQDPVLLATMFDMSREPHPASFSAVVLLLFDAQRDLRLQSFHTLLEFWSGRSSFQKLLPVTAEAHSGDYSDNASNQSKNYNEDDKGVIRYRRHVEQCLDAELEICQALKETGA